MMEWLRLLLRGTRILGVIVICLGVVTWVSLLKRLSCADYIPLCQRLSRWCLARLCAALPFDIQISGQVPCQPMLWVANHVSWSDIPLLGALAPLTFLSKAEVRAWPVIGWLAEKVGTLFIQRGSGSNQLIISRQLAEQLRLGRHLLIFPEGTTTDGQGLRTFHRQLLISAVEVGVAVQPVAIGYRRNDEIDPLVPFIGNDDMLSHLYRLLRAKRATVHIHLLAPIASDGLSHAALARQAQQAVHQALFGVAKLKYRTKKKRLNHVAQLTVEGITS